MDQYLNEDMYPIIASYLNIEDLDTFCNNHQILCNKNTFWTRMIQERFGLNHPIDPKFKYTVLYQGLYMYFTYDKEEFDKMMKDEWMRENADKFITPEEFYNPFSQDISIYMISKYPGTLDYLLKNKIIKLTNDDLNEILENTTILPVNLAKIIIDSYDEINYEFIHHQLDNAIRDDTFNLTKLFYDTCIKLNSKKEVNDRLTEYFYQYMTRITLSTEMYDYIMSKINSDNDPDSVAEFLSSLEDDHGSNQEDNIKLDKLIKHIVSSLPIDYEWDDNFIEQIVGSKPYILLAMLNKMTFTKNRLEEYLQYVGKDHNFGELSEDEILNPPIDEFTDYSVRSNYFKHVEIAKQRILELLESFCLKSDQKDKFIFNWDI